MKRSHIARWKEPGQLIGAVTPFLSAYSSMLIGAGEAGLGAVLTAWGAGMVLGGALLTRLNRIPTRALLLTAAAAQAIACLGMGLSGTLIAVMVWSAVGGVGNGMYDVAFLTALQERTPDRYQARISGLYEALLTAGPGLGFALGGALAALASARSVYVVAGLGSLTVLAWAIARLRGADWMTAAPATAT